MLLNKNLHAACGYKEFRLPGTEISEWFEHRNNGSSISFWFRNKFPAISLCVVTGAGRFWPRFIINGKKHLSKSEFLLYNAADHLVIFDQKEKPFNEGGVILESDGIMWYVLYSHQEPSSNKLKSMFSNKKATWRTSNLSIHCCQNSK